jgi:hypothetical protein
MVVASNVSAAIGGAQPRFQGNSDLNQSSLMLRNLIDPLGGWANRASEIGQADRDGVLRP